MIMRRGGLIELHPSGQHMKTNGVAKLYWPYSEHSPSTSASSLNTKS